MELGRQIKRYRTDLGLSQDGLAREIHVSRQTISNWENDKSYPDVDSLLRLSQLFQVSLDSLIKGDLEEIKARIQPEDIQRFERLSVIYAILLIAAVIAFVPLYRFLHFVGIALWAGLYAAALYFALKVEQQKKRFNIQTYREIVAFTEGQTLDEIARAKESGKRPYQKALLAIGTGAITLAVALLVFLLWR